jgi:hypothetical protein
MAKLQVLIHDLKTDKVIYRDMTAAELKQYEDNQETDALRQAEAEAKATQRAALLDRLGITQEEAKLLLG